MQKARLSVYLEPDTLKALEALADRRGKSKSLVAEAAIASFVSPDASERQEAAITRRLDRTGPRSGSNAISASRSR
jgi:predicted transcriptional regulator